MPELRQHWNLQQPISFPSKLFNNAVVVLLNNIKGLILSFSNLTQLGARFDPNSMFPMSPKNWLFNILK